LQYVLLKPWLQALKHVMQINAICIGTMAAKHIPWLYIALCTAAAEEVHVHCTWWLLVHTLLCREVA
jgi:hypothetical protein